MFANPPLDEICAVLAGVRTIAVVGLSPNENRPSFRIARAMQSAGFDIVPVRPLVREVLGETAYASLAEVPVPIDLVNVFRASRHIAVLVDECIGLRLPRLWIQEGIVDNDAAQRARDAGIWTVMNRCLGRDYNGNCARRGGT